MPSKLLAQTLVAVSFMTLIGSANAALHTSWSSTYNSPENANDSVRGVAVDATSGNVYVTGKSLSATNVKYGATTMAYSAAGVKLWEQRSTTLAGSEAMALASGGNLFVTGTSFTNDFATIAYSPTGVKLWEQSFNGATNAIDSPVAIAVASNGNVYVTGLSTTSTGTTDYVTIAYSSAGVQLWVQSYNGAGNRNDQPSSIAVDSIGNVYVTGNSTDAVSGDGDSYATIAYSSAGVKLWESHYYGPLGVSNYATAIAVGANGNIHVTGYSLSDFFTFNDYATIAYSPAGQQLWEQRFDGGDANGDYASAIAVGANGNVYVTGKRFRYYVLEGSTGNSDYATIAYGANGALLWQRDFGGPAEFQDEGKGIAVNRLGNVLVTGVSQDANQLWDIATVQYDGDTGTQIADQTIDTNNRVGDLSYLAIAPNDKLLVAGGISGANLMDYLTRLFDNGTSNIAPIANAGVDQVLTCTSKQTSVTLDASASTDADNDALSYLWSGAFGSSINKIAPVTFPAGQNTVTLLVTDGNGGSATDNLLVTIQDSQAPTLTAPLDVVAEATSAQGAPYSPSYSASDVCSTVAVTAAPSLALYPLGLTNLTLTATDTSGNGVSATQRLTVRDTKAPVFTSAPVAKTVVSATGNIAVDLGAVVATDIFPVTLTNDAPATFPYGTSLVTWTATDSNGNKASATQSVTVALNADLIPVSVALTQVGSALTLKDSVKNQASATTGTFSVNFYLSLDNLFQATTDTLVCARSIASLAGSTANPTTGTATTACTIPANQPYGSYYLVAVVDGNNQVAETNETNNAKFATAKVAVGVDLSPLSAAVTQSGTALTVTDAVKNLASGPAGAFSVNFYLSLDKVFQSATDALVCSRSVASLAGNTANPVTGSAMTSCSIPVNQPNGSYYLVAVADGNNQVAELLETNNVKVAAAKVAVGVDLSQLSVALTQTGTSLKVTDAVKNLASGSAGAFSVNFYLSLDNLYQSSIDTLICSRSVASLAGSTASPATGSATTVCTIPANLPHGSYYLVAVADGNNLVTELLETNNLKFAAAKVSIGIDLSPLSVAVTQSGSALTVTNAVKNLAAGGPTAGAFSVNFYLSTDNLYQAGTDTLVCSRAVTGLAPNTASPTTGTITTSCTLPVGLATGSYFLIAVADGNNQVTEYVETNNVKVAAVKVAAP